MRQFMMCAFLAAALPVAGFAAEAAAPAPAQPAMVAYVGLISGSVEVQLPGSDVWTLAKLGQALPGGAQIKTQAGASCTVAFSDGTKLRIGPKASFKLEEATPSRVATFIGLGKLEAWVKKMAGRTFQTRNPVAVASVRGTVFAMDVLSPTSATMDVFEGSLAVTDNFGNTAAVAQGQRVEASATTGNAAPAPTPPGVQAPVEPTVTVAPPAAPPAAPAPAPKQAAAPPPPAPPAGDTDDTGDTGGTQPQQQNIQQEVQEGSTSPSQ